MQVTIDSGQVQGSVTMLQKGGGGGWMVDHNIIIAKKFFEK